jgi:ATP-binding cassette subfamily G (WHITE) protein 2
MVSAGRCIYHGPAADVLPFFASVGFTCEEHDNPADFLLDVSQGDYQPILSSGAVYEIDPDQPQDQIVHYLNNAYEKSPVFAKIKQETSGINYSPNEPPKMAMDAPKLLKQSRLSEIFYVSQRTFRNAFRNPALIGMQTGVSIFVGLLVGLIYINTDYSIDIGLKNRFGAIFFIVTNQVFSSLSALDLFIKERPLFKHENVSGYYHVSTYFMSKLLCDVIPLRTIPSILFSVIAYFMINFQRTAVNFFIFFFCIFCTTICSTSVCFLVSASVQVFGKRSISFKLVLFLLFSYCQFGRCYVQRIDIGFQWISRRHHISRFIYIVDQMDQHISIFQQYICY